MMIDLQSLQTVSVDQAGVATVGGGVRLGNLANGIWNSGQRALAHGTCPGVGIGGHFTHGGYGHTSRNYGLAMDQIIAADIVLANGTLIKATSSQSPDIFWAIRGAADSIGIGTKSRGHISLRNHANRTLQSLHFTSRLVQHPQVSRTYNLTSPAFSIPRQPSQTRSSISKM
jgi:hypothetical protein